MKYKRAVPLGRGVVLAEWGASPPHLVYLTFMMPSTWEGEGEGGYRPAESTQFCVSVKDTEELFFVLAEIFNTQDKE